jgi:hypothetical protein
LSRRGIVTGSSFDAFGPQAPGSGAQASVTLTTPKNAKAIFIFARASVSVGFIFYFSESAQKQAGYTVFQIARNCDLDPVPHRMGPGACLARAWDAKGARRVADNSI